MREGHGLRDSRRDHGTARRVSASSRKGRAHLRERLLEVGEALGVGLVELAPELTLAQAQKRLLGGLLVDALGVGARVELGEERDDVRIRLAAVEQVRADAPVQLVLEMLGAELAEDARRDGCARQPASASRSRRTLRSSILCETEPVFARARAASPASTSVPRSSRSAA